LAGGESGRESFSSDIQPQVKEITFCYSYGMRNVFEKFC
jgi:hypothetical protein